VSHQDHYRGLASLKRRQRRSIPFSVARDCSSTLNRRLHVESLEDRRMLAVITVNSDLDNTTPGDALVTLREAVIAANTDATTDLGDTGNGADTIDFAGSLNGGTILLDLGELGITESLSVDGTSLAGGLTINAQDLSRIFNITAGTGDFTFRKLTLTGGSASDEGGAIRSLTSGDLTIDQSTIDGNNTTANYSRGGGIRASGEVLLTDSTVSGNSTTSNGAGGGISASDNVTLTDSIVRDNTSGLGGGISVGGYFHDVFITNSTVTGNKALSFGGGAIYVDEGSATLTNSTLSDNYTNGDFGLGGGILAFGDVTLTESTVSGNSTTGESVDGGGIWAGAVTLTRSTVSGNSSTGTGGGFHAGGVVMLTQSTVTDNHANGAASVGGGIWNDNDTITIAGSIVAGNTAVGGNPDLLPGTGILTVNFSLIGTGITPDAGTSGDNVVTDDAVIGPLADNGGSTQTHAFLPGSPALDAGDPSIIFQADEFDQRGANFFRVADANCIAPEGIIDIGAYEAQFAPSADFDSDDDVDGFDFLAWQRGFGTTVGATKPDGNSDDDGDVDASDLAAWEETFGETTPPLMAAPVVTAASSLTSVQLSAVPTLASSVLADLALAVALDADAVGGSSPNEFEDHSAPQEYFAAEPSARSDIAAALNNSDSATMGKPRDDNQSAEASSPWEDALDEIFASLLQ